MGIQINGNTDIISATDGSLSIQGASGNVTGNLTGNVNSTGISTFNNVTVGGATTALVVNGNARITGILTVGTGSITINPVTDSITGVTTLGVTTAYISAVNDGPLSGARNRIINGDMRIDQRNAGAAVTPSTSAYTLDRFWFNFNQASKITIQQNAASVITPAGFTNYLGATTASAYTPVSSDYFLLSQSIEGYNISDFGWGTANAQSVTISFWVRSSLTGIFSLSLKGGVNRNYLTTYSVSAANTWEKKVITIPGDTFGTWDTTNGSGLLLIWNLGTGPNRENSNINIWNNTDGVIYGVTGNVEPVTTLGATFYLTGVQLEVGTVATPFERRSYGQELALCQRYYYKMYSNTSSANVLGVGFNENTTTGVFQHYFPIPMRTNPTTLQTSGTASDYGVRHANTITTASSVPAFSDATVYNAVFTITVASGLTGGQAVMARAINTLATLAWSAEL